MADVICFKSRAVIQEDMRRRNVEAALDLLDTMEEPVEVVVGVLREMRRNVRRAVIAGAADEWDLRCVLALKQPRRSRRVND